MAAPFEIKPGEGARKITKGTPFNACRALYIGTAGTLNFTPIDGVACTDFPAQAGMLAIATASVQASGTADDIWAIY